ncbi:hypothetical protein AB6A40_005577 [Gnathostoma spinigerum]|uniref:Uncharacterized protein n=1 Tax=Gnathostoma spinigerum TaxID=75299 RepID=A0ABD6EPE8_9BILA
MFFAEEYKPINKNTGYYRANRRRKSGCNPKKALEYKRRRDNVIEFLSDPQKYEGSTSTDSRAPRNADRVMQTLNRSSDSETNGKQLGVKVFLFSIIDKRGLLIQLVEKK